MGLDMGADQIWEKVKENVRLNATTGKSIGYYTDSEMSIDIKHFIFRLSRYKFIAKLMRYEKSVNVLEFGCNEAWGALLLKQNIDLNSYTGIDFDRDTIEWSEKNLPSEFSFICDDFFSYKKQKKLKKMSFVNYF